MSLHYVLNALLYCIFLFTSPAYTAGPPTPPTSSSHTSTITVPPTTTRASSSPTVTAVPTPANSTSSVTPLLGPPDVLLNVPSLSVGRIELDVDNLQADINLAANVAGLVSINAGVAVSIQKINLTIVDIDIVNRVFQSLDLNPLLITALNNVTSVVDTVVGAVDGLLGSITQGGTTLTFLIDNLGNIVQEVAGGANGTVNNIVGNYLTNMTYTGQSQNLTNGLVQKMYSYSPLNTLVNIVFNTAGQIVQATVAK